MDDSRNDEGNANPPEVKVEPQTDSDHVVRIRGLPWSASKDDIIKFFDGAAIKNGAQGIHLTMSKEGRPSGEAYIELDGEEDFNKALGRDNEHLGSRYIEVFRSGKDEMDWALRRCGLDGDEAFGDACVRLRGLPFGCSKEEIAQFFTGLEIVRNGITLPTDFQGRSTGEAYVQFASQDIAEKAMGKHKEKIGHRYIEIFKSSLQEIRSAMGLGPMRMRNMGSNRLSPYDRMDRPGAFGGMSRGRGGKGRFDDGFRSDYGMYDGFSGPGGRRGGPMGGGGSGGSGGFGGGDRINFFGRGNDSYSTGHRVHMRGLPFRAVERDIYEFFAPLNPVSVKIKYEPSGRSSGEADVEFNTHEEAAKAMKRDKEKIQHRYIELFLHSEPEPFRRSGMARGFPEERPFGGGMGRGGGRPFMGDGERPFGLPDRGFGPGGGDRGFGPGSSMDRGFGSSSGDRAFGFSGGDRSFGPSGGSERPFGSPGGRSFGATGGDSRSMMSSERGYSSMGGDYRNGMGGGGGSSGSMGGGYRSESGYGGDGPCKDDSEFYGSGKLFGGDSFQQPMSQGMGGMMGGSNYTSF